MSKLADLIDRHGIPVHDLPGIDPAEFEIPVLDGLQRQGDILVIPDPTARATTPVTKNGTPVVRGENGGNTHAVVGEGEVHCDVKTVTSTRDLTVATLSIAPGSTAFLTHPEHGYMGIGPGNYTIRRQREQADELRVVAD